MTQISQINERDPRTFAIIGAAVEVHKELGSGFLEPVYQEALALEFQQREIPFQREVELAVAYKGRKLGVCYRADFICYDSVVVEVKAVKALSGVDESQIINYLKASGSEVGLLLNFGSLSLQFRRFAYSIRKSASSAQSADNVCVADECVK